ncbi:hypothetical protein BFJ69_g17205 [Fusarium oxysporum]|uniref:Gfo/Idh/MocA-like oxidoreductase N-terminal domain-containing protein n=1 Tax=Fusarium oxysporum TaxID=5507 RepID=A0A420M8Z7_FUSOX|nr:hypothetical protein BFJ69_g17205 [Fusarium oxysporum]
MLPKGSNINVVYIASPNSLHYEQGVKALNAGKHVTMEKPFASNMKELEALYKLADSKGLLILEAYRHIQEPNFKRQMAMYSPLFGDITENNVPNVASPKFSGGFCGIWVAVLSYSLSDSLENPPFLVDRNTAILVEYKPIEGQIKQ